MVENDNYIIYKTNHFTNEKDTIKEDQKKDYKKKKGKDNTILKEKVR